MIRNVLLSLTIVVSATRTNLFAATIKVPADQPTIQAGINVATTGDVVLVSPGTYMENINFKGKAITVKSSGGANVTIIDGGQITAVVSFVSWEKSTSVLSGFTIQNGLAAFSTTNDSAGGILIQNSSPTVTHNVITKNYGCGIGIYFGAPVIEFNTISHTSTSSTKSTYCSPSVASGVLLYGEGTQFGKGPVQLIHNTISKNDGEGIYLWIGGNPLIQSNIISGNKSSGILMQNDGAPLIVQNLIVGNQGTQSYGGGILLDIPNGSYRTKNTVVSDNTIVGNTVPNNGAGSAVYVSGFYDHAIFENNIVIGTGTGAAVDCDATYLPSGPAPLFHHNDVLSANGSDYAGGCAGDTGLDGNISNDPIFAAGYRLKAGSPAIDAGDNAALDLPSQDLAANPRIINGNGGSTAIVDMGAYEFIPVVLAPRALNFGTQPVGSTIQKTLMLTNNLNNTLIISSTTVPFGYMMSGCGTSVAALSSCTLTIAFHPSNVGTFKGALTLKDDAGNSPQSVTLSGSAQ